MKIKRHAGACLAATGLAALLGLARLFATPPDQPLSDRDARGSDGVSCPAPPALPVILSDALVDERPDVAPDPATPPAVHLPDESSVATVAELPEVRLAVPVASAAKNLPSAGKEQVIRERFGVILRDGKWIPAVGDGTNLVYITTGSLPFGRVGDFFEAQLQAVGGCPPYRWVLAGGELPRNFDLDAVAGLISGVASTPLSAELYVEVTDARGVRDVAGYVLTIQPEQELAVVTDRLPLAVPGTDYMAPLQATGGVPPYVWSAAGALDAIGVFDLDPYSGVLQGQIHADAPEIDTPLVFWLSDAQRQVSRELVLPCRSGLAILDVPPVTLRVRETLEMTLQATGGSEPYVWGVEGALPDGLTFHETGLFFGRPAEPGLYWVDLWVQDEAGLADTALLRLEVLPEMTDAVAGFQALLSRNNVALGWEQPADHHDAGVRIVRNPSRPPTAPEDGTTIYRGPAGAWMDRDVGPGDHYYAAFVEDRGVAVTSRPPATLKISLPPAGNPFAARVVDMHLLHPRAYGADRLPDIVLGAPSGTGMERGSTQVLSLGAATNDDDGVSGPYGGMITLEFEDKIWDGPGYDFTVFENVFYIYNAAGEPDPATRFMEPAVVSVSQDGVHWWQFRTDFSPRYHPATGALNLWHPYCYNAGFAGINPVMSNGYDPDPTDPAVSGGDSFDIAEVGFDWIRYVRIQSTGHLWLYDDDGDLVYHNEKFDSASRDSPASGFDLDAVAGIWYEKIVLPRVFGYH